MSSLTIRTDDEIERALASLTEQGKSRSQVVREAILTAEREKRRARLRAESQALRDDPEDRAASKQLAGEMEQVRAW